MHTRIINCHHENGGERRCFGPPSAQTKPPQCAALAATAAVRWRGFWPQDAAASIRPLVRSLTSGDDLDATVALLRARVARIELAVADDHNVVLGHALLREEASDRVGALGRQFAVIEVLVLRLADRIAVRVALDVDLAVAVVAAQDRDDLLQDARGAVLQAIAARVERDRVVDADREAALAVVDRDIAAEFILEALGVGVDEICKIGRASCRERVSIDV